MVTMIAQVIVFLFLSFISQITSSSPIQIKQDKPQNCDAPTNYHQIAPTNLKSNVQQIINLNPQIQNGQVFNPTSKLPAHLNLNEKIRQLKFQKNPFLPAVPANIKTGSVFPSLPVENNIRQISAVKTLNSKAQAATQVQTLNHDTYQIQNQDNNLKNIIRQVFVGNQKHLNVTNGDNIVKYETVRYLTEAEINSQKVISSNKNNRDKEIIIVKPQTSTLTSIPANYETQSSTGTRVTVIQGEQNHKVFNTKPIPTPKEECHDRNIPVFEVIHDDTPVPAYNMSITVLPHKPGTAGSWSKNSLHDVVKKALTQSLHLHSIKLTSSDCEGISNEVTLAVAKSLGLLESGTTGSDIQEVGNAKELSPDTTTEATGPVLFPITPEEDPNNQDLSLEKEIPEIQRSNNGYNDKSTASKATAKASVSAGSSQANANAKSQNLVRRINNENEEIEEREKEIEKKREDEEDEEDSDEENDDDEEEEDC